MISIVQQIRKDLKQNADLKTQKSFQRFFKEKVKCYGVKTGTVGKIAKKHWKNVSALDKKIVFSLCEELYQSDYTEEAFIVSFWLPNLGDKFEKKDLIIFKKWISKYINNWAKCDGFCNHTIGSFIEKYPESITEIKSWSRSKNRWLKRASAVSFIVPAKEGRFSEDAFEISDMLINDNDDMVQKGYGWLLKEESRRQQKEVFDFIISHKNIMPRTALRYAIELMPPELKAKAMKRD